MPYIVRDANGKVSRISVRALVGGELVAHDHADVLEFLRGHGQDPQHVADALNELRRTDSEMSRAIEDVIMVLLKKNIFKMSDLSKPVQDRMALRVKMRMVIQDAYDSASGTKS
jgi:hypothetical protein